LIGTAEPCRDTFNVAAPPLPCPSRSAVRRSTPDASGSVAL